MACSKENEYTYESIEMHYAGKSVFITGGTGFLGKVFVEKLLYSCPKINKIFLLIREKTNLETSEKIKQQLDLPIFDRVRKERPENIEKVVPISGDLVLPNLGISQEDEKLLREKCFGVISGGRPNTYTFTKALAESVVNEEHGDVPTIIIRPSITSASLREPLTGWLENLYGATALIATAAKGYNRCLLSKSTNIVDMIPVDYVSNLIVAAAAKCKRSKEVTVYNSCTSDANPITMGLLRRLVLEDSRKHNLYGNNLNYIFFLTQSKWLLYFLTPIMQTIPAFVVDCWLFLTFETQIYEDAEKDSTCT